MELLSRRDGNLREDELYKQYEQYVSELVHYLINEENCHSAIAQEERNIVAEIENEYMKSISELKRARQTVSSQYRSVWESCTGNTGLRRPEDQRPSYTDIEWNECVSLQEKAAKEIQKWFEEKRRQAVEEKQIKLQQEKEKKVVSALLAAEAERKRKEEAAALEAARGASLLEEMKQKFRKNL